MPDLKENKPHVDQTEIINTLLGQIANLHLQVAILQSRVKQLSQELSKTQPQ